VIFNTYAEWEHVAVFRSIRPVPEHKLTGRG